MYGIWSQSLSRLDRIGSRPYRPATTVVVEPAASESKELLQADHSHSVHGGGRGGFVVWEKKSSFEGMEKDYVTAVMSVANGTAATATTTTTTDASTESKGHKGYPKKDDDDGT